ncbi:MAG: energy transducer TonB [Bryobacteraceae bacterium]
MFEQSFLKGAPRTRRVGTALISFVSQAILVGVGVLMPLIAFDRLPQTRLTPPLVAPPPPPGPRNMEARPHVTLVPAPHGRVPRLFTAPAFVPTRIAMNLPPEPEPATADNTDYVPFSPGAGPGGVPHGVGNAPWRIAAPPPPPEPKHDVKPVAKPQVPVAISRGVMMAKLIHQVTPPYPPLARQTRVSGTVLLQAIIGRDGCIGDLQVLSGHPLLVPAAVDAVRQWLYQPTTLNGSPVEVLTTVEVRFVLSL